eukprot:2596396-Alexandrium_andersonii.AAC.1
MLKSAGRGFKLAPPPIGASSPRRPRSESQWVWGGEQEPLPGGQEAGPNRSRPREPLQNTFAADLRREKEGSG